ncbi:MAG: hypothetical protein JXR91_04610 [Deltaproteobacteria bacterium]|nr:hypothetical protein [Deltaproteobacteria bacterium]
MSLFLIMSDDFNFIDDERLNSGTVIETREYERPADKLLWQCYARVSSQICDKIKKGSGDFIVAVCNSNTKESYVKTVSLQKNGTSTIRIIGRHSASGKS